MKCIPGSKFAEVVDKGPCLADNIDPTSERSSNSDQNLKSGVLAVMQMAGYEMSNDCLTVGRKETRQMALHE